MSSNRNRTVRRFNAARHIAMGIVLMFCAYMLVKYRQFARIDISAATSYVAAAVLVVYGLFRIWRGTRELQERDVDDFIS